MHPNSPFNSVIFPPPFSSLPRSPLRPGWWVVEIEGGTGTCGHSFQNIRYPGLEDEVEGIVTAGRIGLLDQQAQLSRGYCPPGLSSVLREGNERGVFCFASRVSEIDYTLRILGKTGIFTTSQFFWFSPAFAAV